MRFVFRSSLLVSSLCAGSLCAASLFLTAQTPGPSTAKPAVPAWAQPGSATYTQVAPPTDFHRPSTTFNTPIGIFDGQSDVGSAVVPGKATYDGATKQYTVDSAGYNIWYSRDEFRFLWKKMSGDASLAADVSFPDPKGYGDRKAVLVIRQSLDDDSKEVVVGLHGAGMLQLAQRAEKNIRMIDTEFRVGGRGRPGGSSPDSLVTMTPRRIGLEKHGDAFTVYASFEGEPIHPMGPPIHLNIQGPFYIGIGFCSHLPDKSDTALFSNVSIENGVGNLR